MRYFCLLSHFSHALMQPFSRRISASCNSRVAGLIFRQSSYQNEKSCMAPKSRVSSSYCATAAPSTVAWSAV